MFFKNNIFYIIYNFMDLLKIYFINNKNSGFSISGTLFLYYDKYAIIIKILEKKEYIIL